jgi:hypothetical protein
MKSFSNYQYVKGEEMLDRDKLEANSKFWVKGKWDNFVLPFLPKNCKGLTLVDMGCNAGVFLELAENKGFRAIGVDADKTAVKKGLRYRRRNGGHYKIMYRDMRNCIDDLPAADFTILANSHYYFPIDHWLEYLNKLKEKTCYVIIVTAQKMRKYSKASADLPDIRNYFKDWDEVGFVDELPLEGDPFPRRLWGLCFKNRNVERVDIESLCSGNNVQNTFYPELDKGVDPLKTHYHKILVRYRKGWSTETLNKFMQAKKELYEDVKKNGVKNALIVDLTGRVMDGNHRYQMLKHLGNKTVIVRKT